MEITYIKPDISQWGIENGGFDTCSAFMRWGYSFLRAPGPHFYSDTQAQKQTFAIVNYHYFNSNRVGNNLIKNNIELILLF
jgi:hypothetical protein